MTTVIKIPNYDEVNRVLGGHYKANEETIEKMKVKLEDLYAKKDLTKYERDETGQKIGNGLELICFVELGYFEDRGSYFYEANDEWFNHESEDEHKSIESLIQEIYGSELKNVTHYGAPIKPLFYTVTDHSFCGEEMLNIKDSLDKLEKDFPKEEKSILKSFFDAIFGNNPLSRGLNDEEIKKFQNLYK